MLLNKIFFTKVQEFVDTLNNNSNSKAISKVKKLIKSKTLKKSLIEIKEFEFLPEILTKLEERNLKLEIQINIVEEIKSKLSGYAKAKFKNCLEKNPGYNDFITNQDFEHKKIIKFAPLVSIEVERSFSQYKNLLGDNKQRFTPENLIMYHTIQFNSFLAI